MTQRQSQVTLLTVGKFAQICRTTPRTIRFYEKKGLLKPALIDTFSGYRFYNPKQAREVFKIKLLQNFNLSLKDVSKSIKKYNEYGFLEEKLGKIKEEIEQKQKEYLFLKDVNNFLFGKKELKRFLKTENIGPFMLFATTIKHGRYDQIDNYARDLYRQAKKFKIKTTDKYIILYLEPDRYGPGGIDMELGLISIKKANIKLPSSYYFKTLPKQKAVIYDYKGPEQYLTFVHKRLFYDDYFKKHKFSNLPFDWCVRNFVNTKSQYDYLTKVVYPIE